MNYPSIACFLGLFLTCLCGRLEFDSFSRAEWLAWKQENDRVYSSHEEELTRSYVWLQNWNFINQHNKYADEFGFTLKMNPSGDMTREQWLNTYMGYTTLPNSTMDKMEKFKAPLQTDYPEEVDWRNHNAVVYVKDQLKCNASYAFSAAGALEGAVALAHDKLERLSEQNIIDCSVPYGNHGCRSGSTYVAFQYILDAEGINLEKAYKYKSAQGQCKRTPSNSRGEISGVVSIEPGNERDLMAAVATVGPISVGIDASSNAFRFYHGGRFNVVHCSRTKLNHAVVLIGYGTNYNGKNYWIVRNSWGPNWGEGGYIKMAKDSYNQCGIATNAMYPTL